jgi:hypothetical protein
MVGVLLCAILATGADPLPPPLPDAAPPPREVRPDVWLIVDERVDGAPGGVDKRVLRIGFRNGKPLPAEVILACGEEDYWRVCGGDIRANRYLVSKNGSVLDLRGRGFLNRVEELNFDRNLLVRADDTKVTYWTAGQNRPDRLFTFEYATRTRTHIKEPKPWLIPAGVPRSPDGTKAVYSVRGDLTLHRDGEEPKSLGTDLNSDLEPVLWLGNDRVLTQRETGKLVTVTLDGTVTDLLTIKDAPKGAIAELARDPEGAVVLTFPSEEGESFKIDLANKTAAKAVWRGLGHGFEVARADDTVRHGGKKVDMGQLGSCTDKAAAAPGYLAVPVHTDGCAFHIAVWSAASGTWTRFDFPWAQGVLGWIE